MLQISMILLHDCIQIGNDAGNNTTAIYVFDAGVAVSVPS